MSFSPEILTRAIAEAREEIERLADLLVDINAAKNDQAAVQSLVLDALTRVELCKLTLNLETDSLVGSTKYDS